MSSMNEFCLALQARSTAYRYHEPLVSDGSFVLRVGHRLLRLGSEEISPWLDGRPGRPVHAINWVSGEQRTGYQLLLAGAPGEAPRTCFWPSSSKPQCVYQPRAKGDYSACSLTLYDVVRAPEHWDEAATPTGFTVLALDRAEAQALRALVLPDVEETRYAVRRADPKAPVVTHCYRQGIDEKGCLTREVGRAISEVLADVSESLEHESLLGEYFSMGNALRYGCDLHASQRTRLECQAMSCGLTGQSPWPAAVNWVECSVVKGGSEGHYAHIRIVLRDPGPEPDRTLLLAINKHFDEDEAWRAARLVAQLLEE